MLVTDDDAVAERVRRLRWLGISSDTWSRFNNGHEGRAWEYEVEEVGYKYCMNDIAAALGAEGHVTVLRRTRVGPFAAEQCHTLDELSDLAHKARLTEVLSPVQTSLDDIPAVAVTEGDAFSLKQGREIVLLPRIATELREKASPRTIDGKDASRWALAHVDGTAVAIGDARAGRMTPVRVFNLT